MSFDHHLRSETGTGRAQVALALFALVALVLLGALAGSLIRTHGFLSYRTKSSLALVDVASYKRLKPMLDSISNVERFITISPPGATSALPLLAERLMAGRHDMMTVDLEFPIVRSDVRDLPDQLSNDLLSKKSNISEFTRPTLVVNTSGPTPSSAVERHKDLLNYVNDTLVYSSLKSYLSSLFLQYKEDEADTQNKIAADELKLLSLSRQKEEITGLKDKYSERSASTVPEQSGLGAETIQVPTNETRFLSPLRQLIGVEAQRVELTEKLRGSRGKLEKARAIEQYVRSMLGQMDSAPMLAKDLLAAAVSKLDSVTTTSTDPDERLAVESGRTELAGHLAVLSTYYAYSPTKQSDFQVILVGPSRIPALAAGALLGLLCWLAAYRVLRRSNGSSPERNSAV